VVGIFPVEQRVARSVPERWPAACRGTVNKRFKAIDSRERGGLVAAPFKLGSGNGCQSARPCFTRRPVAPFCGLCLDCGSRRFQRGLFVLGVAAIIDGAERYLALTEREAILDVNDISLPIDRAPPRCQRRRNERESRTDISQLGLSHTPIEGGLNAVAACESADQRDLFLGCRFGCGSRLCRKLEHCCFLIFKQVS
jgi:hypothetical protein